MRLQLNGISPSFKESLLASLDTSSVAQFSMHTGSVYAEDGVIKLNLQRASELAASAGGTFDTGISSPVTISRVEVEMEVMYASFATEMYVRVAGMGVSWSKGQLVPPPKTGRAYSFSNSGLGQGLVGTGVSHGALPSPGLLSVSALHRDAPADGPLFRAADFARILRIDVWGDWWWGDD